jgi:hypothetical protein
VITSNLTTAGYFTQQCSTQHGNLKGAVDSKLGDQIEEGIEMVPEGQFLLK